MTTETEALRHEIEGLSDHRQTRRYSPDLQRRVTAWAKIRAGAGASVPKMCLEIGIGEPTLRRFLAEASSGSTLAKEPGFTRVRMVSAVPASARGLVIHGPCETRLEGLSLNEVAELFRRLACSV